MGEELILLFQQNIELQEKNLEIQKQFLNNMKKKVKTMAKSIKKGRVLMIKEKGRFLVTDDIPITYIDEN